MKGTLAYIAPVAFMGILLLSGCTTPVMVYKTVDVPVKCQVSPIVLRSLSVDRLPLKASTAEILQAMYSDQVLMRGEILALNTILEGCE